MPRVQFACMTRPGAAVEVRDAPEPDLEPGGALLRVVLSEVCGTDVHLLHGRLQGVPYPFIPGHVAVGVLEKVRGDLTDVEGRPLREGQPATFLDVHRTCNACWYCLVAKASTRCPERRVYGITYGLDDGLTGGWAEKIVLKPGTRILPLAESAFERFMAGGCALPTALHAVERAEVAIADTALVLGTGPVGLASVILSRMRGAGRVLAIGAPALRVETARAVGASDALDFTGRSVEERLEWVRSLTGGRGADATIEATGRPEAVAEAMRFTRDAGRVVVAGQYTDGGETAFNPHRDLNRKHLEVRGCWGSDYSHFHRAALLAEHPDLSAPFERIPLVRYGLDGVNEALKKVARGEVVKALVDPAM